MEVEVDGRRLKLTNLDKVLWPKTGTTKGELLDYYETIAPILLPHIAARPLTLGRYPDGVEGTNWYQTSCPHPPGWVPTHPVPRRDGRGFSRDYCIVNELAALLWVVNLGAIELHPLLGRTNDIDVPTVVAFDLDPGEGSSMLDCGRLSLSLRRELDELGLVSFAKTSGSMGLHVYVPLNTPVSYAETKHFARELARSLVRRHAGRVIDVASRAHRTHSVFIDWSQNDANKSLVAPYSLRAMPWPSASTPMAWEEIEESVRDGARQPFFFDARTLLERISAHGDLFREVLEVSQQLPAASSWRGFSDRVDTEK